MSGPTNSCTTSSANTEKGEYFKAAQEMYRLEHTRWNQHMLLFLGIIASLLTFAQSIKDLLPLDLTARLAAVVSFLWLCAILSNRSSSHAWQNTLKALENDPTTKPFHTFMDERRSFGLLKDFFSNFSLTPANGSSQCRFLLFSAVTRVYVGLALVLTATFVVFPWLANHYRATNASSVAQTELGSRLIQQALLTQYPNAQIVDAFGPLRRTDGKEVIQLHLTLAGKGHVITNWILAGNGATLEP